MQTEFGADTVPRDTKGYLFLDGEKSAVLLSVKIKFVKRE